MNWNSNFLLLDIETAPHRVYAWGLYGQDIGLTQIEEPGYTLCWAAKWLHRGRVMFSSRFKDGHEQMIGQAHELISEADAVIHYNGARFDLPTLNQEFVKLNLAPPRPYKQIDLLQTARKRFRLASNKLDFVARHLGLPGKLPHKGMELWRGCMEGNPADWRTMEKYNKRDVVLLEQVYDRLLPWVVDHPAAGLLDPALRGMNCQTCGSPNLTKQGFRIAKTGRYQQFKCSDCGSWMRKRVKDRSEAPLEVIGGGL